MAPKRGLIILAGYLVRYPLGGYAWQILQCLPGLRSLGYDVWFYEDTGYCASAFNPVSNSVTTDYDYGIKATTSFFDSLGACRTPGKIRG